MRQLDAQEKLIIRHLVRDPRCSDNAIAEATGINVRTVSRKRRRMEEDNLLSYHTQLDLLPSGTGQFNDRHLYIIKFRIGITYQQIISEIRSLPSLHQDLSKIIYESHLAEIDGQVALLLSIDGTGAAEIVQTVHEKIIPMLLDSHGRDSIEKVSTIRLLAPVRLMRNYLPLVNMHHGFIKPDWKEEYIYTAE